jgi:ATP-dependent helicase YprA (DUF1998 family)
MSSTEQSEYGVAQVAEQLQQRLQRYLEAQYHIRNTGLIEERRALLSETGAIAQHPFLETTPTYRIGDQYAKLGLPTPVGETLAELAEWRPGIGVFPKPYSHQADSLSCFFKDGADLIVATGTGSGKTECFLFPVLGHLLLEGAHRRASFQTAGCRALLLYPMNALVSDQVSRLRKLFGDERLRDLFRQRYGRHPRFGMYTSRTPYPGPRFSKKDSKFLLPVLRYYLDLQDPPADLPETERELKRSLARELKDRGRWPAKDLTGFFGSEGGRWNQRLKTQTGDRELLTRHEIHAWCPDILVTNYSMLEYMLLRPIERSIFGQTKKWLGQNRENSLILVLDEAHMYRGAGGAEVALLIRRLQSRLGVSRDRLRCILTSASLGEGAEAKEAIKMFAVGLTGHPEKKQMPFEVVKGFREEQPAARPGNRKECEALATFDLPTFFRLAERPIEAVGGLVALSERLGWPKPPEVPTFEDASDALAKLGPLRQYLYEQLVRLGPIAQLISTTSGKARRFSSLSEELFRDCEKESAEIATTVLLALGTFANNGERPVLPTRVHLMFRGLPSLYACINPRCEVRRYQPGEDLLLGRLYTEPKTRCSCSLEARVYELYTHRDCGAAFLHVFGRGRQPVFYWHEQGGDVASVGQPLDEDFLLVEPPHPEMLAEVEPLWIEMSTGRVEAPDPAHPERYREVFRPSRAAAPPPGPGRTGCSFPTCPVCTKQQASEKIMDLATKGEQPFANLVREQLVLQPMKRRPDGHYPNGGRKVLLFSDGRQKAARLARDLPREVEFDSFRQALALAVKRVKEVGREVTLDERLYAGFVSVCSEFNLYFFESGAQGQLFDAVKSFRELYDGDLQLALDENWRPEIPQRYSQALLRQLSDPYYSLYAACAAVTQPSGPALRLLKRQQDSALKKIGEEQLLPVVSMWTQQLLDRAAFNLQLNEEARYRVNNFYRPIQWNEKISRFDRLLAQFGELTEGEIQALRERFYLVLADRNPAGHAFLKPSSLVLSLAMDAIWLQCASCGVCMIHSVLGRCPLCRADRFEERSPDHPYMTSRKGYFRESLRAVLAGERPIHLTAEEHTAQLSQRDAGVVYATTEEYELRFQDVALGPDKPPIDVLSCTTTMEVGIDIGSLTAVALRNVPPQRENYQQRSGRAGRRGSAVSTVVTYAQGGPHDNYYYSAPEEIISGEPRLPKVKVDNRRLARRHIHSYLIQTFFHGGIDRLTSEEEKELAASRSSLFSALGRADAFFTGEDDFSLRNFKRWLEEHVLGAGAEYAGEIAMWLPDELFPNSPSVKDRFEKKRSFAMETAQGFLDALEKLRCAYPSQQAAPAASEDVGDEQAENDLPLLLDVLFDRGLLPTYAFPTDLCSFYVFERDGVNVRIKERPQQSKDKALSEYAPGRLLVINKETYRVGGIYVEGTNSATPGTRLFSSPLGTYVYCPLCSHVRTSPLVDVAEPCPVCQTPLVQHEVLDPPGFSPENGEAVDDRDREQEISYATSAQFPSPAEPDKFEWKTNAGEHLRHAYEQDRRLVIANRGPEDLGFRVCRSCGAAKPTTEDWPQHGHLRPFQVPVYVMQRDKVGRRCNGQLTDPIYLSHSFLTDLLLLRVPLHEPLAYDPRHPWIHAALRTAAEALSLGASRVLDVDAGELSAGYRLIPASGSDDARALGVADFYLFDTASGGAGYAAEAGDILPRVLDQTMKLLRECPKDCERSCTNCLRHYGNRYWQEHLDRYLAIDLLNYARLGQLPAVASVERQAWELAPLQRFLELEGWTSETKGLVEGTRVPLVVKSEAKGNGDVFAVGTYPALLNRDAEGFRHPLHELDSEDDVKLVLLNQFVVSRDLPTAYRHFRKQAGLDR